MRYTTKVRIPLGCTEHIHTRFPTFCESHLWARRLRVRSRDERGPRQLLTWARDTGHHNRVLSIKALWILWDTMRSKKKHLWKLCEYYENDQKTRFSTKTKVSWTGAEGHTRIYRKPTEIMRKWLEIWRNLTKSKYERKWPDKKRNERKSKETGKTVNKSMEMEAKERKRKELEGNGRK